MENVNEATVELTDLPEVVASDPVTEEIDKLARIAEEKFNREAKAEAAEKLRKKRQFNAIGLQKVMFNRGQEFLRKQENGNVATMANGSKYTMRPDGWRKVLEVVEV